MTGTAMMLDLDFAEETDPRKRHEAWLIEASILGWKWGPETDLDAKRTPRFCPFDELPENKV